MTRSGPEDLEMEDKCEIGGFNLTLVPRGSGKAANWKQRYAIQEKEEGVHDRMKGLNERQEEMSEKRWKYRDLL